MDQIYLGAPAERTIQRWKYDFKKEMNFIENVMNENYIDSGPLADLHRQSKKIPEDEIQYGSILYDAICFITKTIQLDDGTTKNVLEVIDRNGNVKNMPIKYAFAQIWSNHKREYGSQEYGSQAPRRSRSQGTACNRAIDCIGPSKEKTYCGCHRF
ncbi:Hypothetical_protein [Hexamita inflata]|uniref:Hypothetical_protein n=1 Tax=Hexamita inflata TaxID=28002 RepID=A0AA86QJK4_9EUKA|nr:Hypothetical protein HINF_LOCUS45192 [Hexamita inflata]